MVSYRCRFIELTRPVVCSPPSRRGDYVNAASPLFTERASITLNHEFINTWLYNKQKPRIGLSSVSLATRQAQSQTLSERAKGARVCMASA